MSVEDAVAVQEVYANIACLQVRVAEEFGCCGLSSTSSESCLRAFSLHLLTDAGSTQALFRVARRKSRSVETCLTPHHFGQSRLGTHHPSRSSMLREAVCREDYLLRHE